MSTDPYIKQTSVKISFNSLVGNGAGDTWDSKFKGESKKQTYDAIRNTNMNL